MGIGGPVLSALAQFLSNRSQTQYVVVDGCQRKFVNVMTGVSQGSVFGAQLSILFNSELNFMLENKLYSYAYDSTLVIKIPRK